MTIRSYYKLYFINMKYYFCLVFYCVIFILLRLSSFPNTCYNFSDAFIFTLLVSFLRRASYERHISGLKSKSLWVSNFYCKNLMHSHLLFSFIFPLLLFCFLIPILYRIIPWLYSFYLFFFPSFTLSLLFTFSWIILNETPYYMVPDCY